MYIISDPFMVSVNPCNIDDLVKLVRLIISVSNVNNVDNFDFCVFFLPQILCSGNVVVLLTLTIWI